MRSPLAATRASLHDVTFTCPHYDPDEEWCLLLGKDCVPGRPGCVARGNSVYLVPVEERIKAAEEARRERERLRMQQPKRP